MIERQCVWTALGLMVLLARVAFAGPDDAPPQPPAEAAEVDKILDAWHDRAEGWTRIDVRLTLTENGSRFPIEENFEGRLVLSGHGRASLECTRAGKPAETRKSVWTETGVYRSFGATRDEILLSRTDADRGRLPTELALPFLWNADPDILRARYRISFQRNGSGLLVFKFTPRGSSSAYRKILLQLDPSTYLPLRVLLFSADSNSSRDIRFVEVQTGGAILDDLFHIPAVKPVHPVVAWLLRGSRSDWLP